MCVCLGLQGEESKRERAPKINNIIYPARTHKCRSESIRNTQMMFLEATNARASKWAYFSLHFPASFYERSLICGSLKRMILEGKSCGAKVLQIMTLKCWVWKDL